MSMETLEKLLQEWKSSLCQEIEIAALYARNPTAHKWKATYRSIVLRELVAWRLLDLLSQTMELQNNGHILGARILLRSSLETLAILVYLNQKTESVLSGIESFDSFSEITTRLMLGSKNKVTKHESINVLTVLEKCDKKYAGILDAYNNLSESAHPNMEGVYMGYSSIDKENYVTKFKNCWQDNFGTQQIPLVELTIRVFEHEYNEIWLKNFEKLERWLEENDAKLEASKSNI